MGMNAMAFLIGLAALLIFFFTILFSLIGVIPQDRMPIQTALVVMTFVIAVIAFVGHQFEPSVPLIRGLDLEGQIIIHPITALVAGFLVAGALEASGAFEAAVDMLDRLERFKLGKWKVFGVAGTVTILVNMPTMISMPCGRILAAALMPAALYFGYKVAKQLKDPRIIGAVVFGFIVNAAASCGPSPLGGIGLIGEGLARLPIGTFTCAQQAGILLCTGVTMIVIRFATPIIPPEMVEAEAGKDDGEKDEAEKEDSPASEPDTQKEAA